MFWLLLSHILCERSTRGHYSFLFERKLRVALALNAPLCILMIASFLLSAISSAFFSIRFVFFRFFLFVCFGCCYCLWLWNVMWFAFNVKALHCSAFHVVLSRAEDLPIIEMFVRFFGNVSRHNMQLFFNRGSKLWWIRWIQFYFGVFRVEQRTDRMALKRLFQSYNITGNNLSKFLSSVHAVNGTKWQHFHFYW